MDSNSNKMPRKELTKISAKAGSPLDFKELWAYRELFCFFVWRDIKVRYHQTILGVLWVLLQPLCTIVVFSLFFGKFANLPSDGIPYPIFVLTGLIPWFFFANGFMSGANSLVGEGALIKKVYFPRLLVPLSKICMGVLDFAIGLILLMFFLLFYDLVPTIRFFALPLAFLFLLAATMGISILFAAMNVLFRDIKHLIPFMTQLWLFATPIVYSTSLVPPEWQFFYALNPMVGVVECFRWALLGSSVLSFEILATSISTTVVVLIGGWLYFNAAEEHFADIV